MGGSTGSYCLFTLHPVVDYREFPMKLLIAGAGGHGRVVADAALTSGAYAEISFVDDRYPSLALPEGWPIVAALREVGGLLGQFDAFVAAFGNAALRLEMLALALEQGARCPVIAHATAFISRYANLGEGSVACPNAVVGVGARLGMGCIVNTGATIDHDCILADGVHICPGAHLAGNVTIGARTWFGIGAVVKQGVKIGADVTVGAGAVVIRDVPANTTVAGNPARVLSLNTK